MSIVKLTDLLAGQSKQNLNVGNIECINLNATTSVTVNGTPIEGTSATVVVSNVGGGGNFTGDTEICINDAINSITGAGTVYIKAGTYTISNKIVLNNNVNIIGDGFNSNLVGNNCDYIMQSVSDSPYQQISNIQFSGTSTVSHFQFNSSHGYIYSCFFHGTTPIDLDVNDSGSTQQFFICNNCVFETSTNTHIFVSVNNWNLKIQNCFFNNASIGVDNFGFSTQINNSLFVSNNISIQTNLGVSCNTTTFAVCAYGIVAAVITSPIPLDNLIGLVNCSAASFGSSNSVLQCSVPTGLTCNYFIQNLVVFGLPLLGNALVVNGLGTHGINFYPSMSIMSVGTDGLGIISTDTNITQPNIALAVEPTAFYGMIYLDDGTNSLSGRPCFRRYNGVSWIDLS